MRERIIGLLQSSGLPQDALCDCARVTMTGRSCVMIEGQHGVVELTKERIRLVTGEGVLFVLGRNLTLNMLSANQAVIRGDTIDMASYRSVSEPDRGETRRED